MKQIQFTKSAGVPHESMDEEFLCHKSGSEWWYCTGYLKDETGKFFSFQFTLARVRVYSLQLHILMTAVTDFETGKHYYAQHPIFFGRNVIVTPEKVALDGVAQMNFSAENLELNIEETGYSLSLNLDVIKPRVWHCQDGILKMGVEDPKETTFYSSYTNLAASGKLVLDDKEYAVVGKAWFDKQGGTYNIINRLTHWEWFSLRFFDDEEVMLFSFPQDNYQDGTYIDKTGDYQRLNQYTVLTQGFAEAGGKKFSFGWTVDLPGIKDEHHSIIPILDGQLNLTYFELLADIRDSDDRSVGYCVVELLPGVYNEKIDVLSVLANVKA